MTKGIKYIGFLFAIVLFSYVGADAQIIRAAEKVADKVKVVIVDAAAESVEAGNMRSRQRQNRKLD